MAEKDIISWRMDNMDLNIDDDITDTGQNIVCETKQFIYLAICLLHM